MALSPLSAMIALTGGLAIYMVVAVVVMGAHPALRYKVGHQYLKMAMRTYGQAALVRRQMGYELLPLEYDDEQKQMQVTLSSSTLPGGKDNVHRFKDPNGRSKRLWQKPLTITDELIPVALDAELAEIGYWLSEKRVNEGLNRGEKVDPWLRVKSGVRLADPRDAITIVCNGAKPSNIKTIENLTKKRFEKYNAGIGLEQTMRVVIGFGVGAGSIIAMNYFTTEIMDGGGGTPGGPIISNPVVWIPSPVLDVMAVAL